jgi:glycosyltransferase involved in cell wall biosynthesis
MNLLYFHSPLPPAESGIADYTFEILARLKNHFDIVIVDDGECLASANALLLPTMPTAVWRDMRKRSLRGIDIYHLGNNRFHTAILQRALLHPGLCAIHDASLTGLLLSSPKLWPAFRRFAEYDLGVHAERFIEARERFEIFGWQDFLLRNLGLIADSSLGVVVHSEYVESLIRRRHQPRHLFRLHHHLADEFRSREGAAIASPLIVDFLRENASRVKVATFGFLTPPKRIDWIVEATRSALAAGADIALILGGRPHHDTKIPEVIRDLPRERVLVTGYLSEPDMRGLMCATDLHLALRFPSVGESSGTLTRALGLGVPSVVLDHEAFSEFPADHVIKVPLTGDAACRLGDVLVDFCANRAKYAERAAAARRWVIEHASLDRSVSRFAEAVRTVSREKPRVSNLFRDLAGELMCCIASQAKEIRLNQPIATPEDLAERVGDSLLINQAAIAITEACRAEYVSLVVYAHRDKPSTRRKAPTEPELIGGRVRKAVLVVGSVDLQVCNIDYVVEEIGIERFDVLLFVLLPVALMSRPVVPGDRAFEGRLPDYLRERGNAAAWFRIAPRSLGYIKIPPIELPSEEIEVPLRIIACEALI